MTILTNLLGTIIILTTCLFCVNFCTFSSANAKASSVCLSAVIATISLLRNLPPNHGFTDAKWPKVEEAWEYFFPNIKYKEAHRALDDAKHEALITYELYKRGKFTI